MLSRLTDIKALLTACNLKPIYGYISGFLVNYIKNVGEVTSYLQKRSEVRYLYDNSLLVSFTFPFILFLS